MAHDLQEQVVAYSILDYSYSPPVKRNVYRCIDKKTNQVFLLLRTADLRENSPAQPMDSKWQPKLIDKGGVILYLRYGSCKREVSTNKPAPRPPECRDNFFLDSLSKDGYHLYRYRGVPRPQCKSSGELHREQMQMKATAEQRLEEMDRYRPSFG